MYLTTIEELETAEKAVGIIYFTEEGYGDITFPVVYFYDKTVMPMLGNTENRADYDLYSYLEDNGKSEQEFKDTTFTHLLKSDPELIVMTIDELQTDYPEYLI